MAAGTKAWSSTLIVVLAVMLIVAAKPSAASTADDDGDGAHCSKHLPKECAADVFSDCHSVPFPLNWVFPSCNLDDKVRVCCEKLKEMKMKEHSCAKCPLLKEFDAVPEFDPAKCDNGVQEAVKHCKYCEKNPSVAGCKDA